VNEVVEVMVEVVEVVEEEIIIEILKHVQRLK
jgi:hypothetical protein